MTVALAVARLRNRRAGLLEEVSRIEAQRGVELRTTRDQVNAIDGALVTLTDPAQAAAVDALLLKLAAAGLDLRLADK